MRGLCGLGGGREVLCVCDDWRWRGRGGWEMCVLMCVVSDWKV